METTTTKQYIGTRPLVKCDLFRKYGDTIHAANAWVVPLLKELNFPVTKDRLAAVMAREDKRQHLVNLLFASIGQHRKDIWQPSVVAAVTKEAERIFDTAFDKVLTQQKPYLSYLADLERGQRHFDEYIEDPAKFEPEGLRQELERLRFNPVTYRDAEAELDKLRSLKRGTISRWQAAMDEREREAKEQGRIEWREVERTSYNLSGLWKYTNAKKFDEEGIIEFNDLRIRERMGTWAKTPEELALLDILRGIIDKCNATFGEGARAALLDLTAEDRHHHMCLRSDISQHDFSKYASNIKLT